MAAGVGAGDDRFRRCWAPPRVRIVPDGESGPGPAQRERIEAIAAPAAEEAAQPRGRPLFRPAVGARGGRAGYPAAVTARAKCTCTPGAGCPAASNTRTATCPPRLGFRAETT